MRHIGHLPNPSQGRRFGDFLVAKGIRNEIEPEPDGSALIWIVEDDQLGEAQIWLEKYRANPRSGEFSEAASRAAKARRVEADELAKYHRRIRSRKSLFLDFGGYGAGILTFTLIGICLVVAGYTRLGSDADQLTKLFISDPDSAGPGFLPEIFQHGEGWRLVTPMFIHFGPLHLLFNLMWLYQLGSMIEARQSPLRLLLLVVATGIISNLAQYIFAGPQFGGMSGVVYALAGYVWLRGKYDRASGLLLDRHSVIILLVWLAACCTGILGPIANFAHLAGLVSGMAIGRVSAYIAVRRPE